ncbi:hypothetical protein [Bacillus sp. FJAT-52991]|uniref:Uncharacterized protein n=1 Tax=Bacillus kandeliae TaxID=3129297 RepID=A0ABZ2N9X2_9BACI
MIKTGAMEITEIELRRRYRPIKRLSAKFNKGLRFQLVFVVSKQRSFGDHQLVQLQSERKGNFGRYSKSLLDSMFKNW